MHNNHKMGSSDSLLKTIREIMEKKHTTPETPKEKSLAKLAHPKDKITHKDVLVGRGVLKKENSGDRMGVIVGTRKEKVELEPKLKESEQVTERKLTGAETEKKEKYVMSLKGKMGGFKKRYGERAKEVMYATATKMAKEEIDQIDEMYTLKHTKTTNPKNVTDDENKPVKATEKHYDVHSGGKKVGEVVHHHNDYGGHFFNATLHGKKVPFDRQNKGEMNAKAFIDGVAKSKWHAKTVKEDVHPVAEVSTGLANRYLSKTQGDDKRQAGRALALKKKWGSRVRGADAPKVPTKD